MSTTGAAEHIDREQWLERRKNHLTASDVMAAVGLHEYKTPEELRDEKLGIIDGPDTTGQMERGHKMEPLVVEVFEETTGRKTRRVPFRVHPGRPLFACSLDRQVFAGVDKRDGDERPTRPLETKTFGRYTFNKTKMQGLPDYVLGQCQLQAEVWSYDATEVAILEPESWDRLILEVPLDADFTMDLMDRAEEWWDRHIVRRRPIERGSDIEDIELPEVSGELIPRTDEDFLEASKLLVEAREMKKEISDMEKAAKAKLEAALGDEYGAFQGDGIRVYRTMQEGRKRKDWKKLQSAEPIDRFALEVQMRAFFENERLVEEFLEAAGDKVRMDLEKFITTGSPFQMIRTYITELDDE